MFASRHTCKLRAKFVEAEPDLGLQRLPLRQEMEVAELREDRHNKDFL